jgi:hypothetical protein
MTVAQFKAFLEDSSVDPFGEIQFYDKDGNRQEVTLKVVGATKSLSPAQPADPSYVKLQLQIPG